MKNTKNVSLVAVVGLLLAGAAYSYPSEGSKEVTIGGVGQSDKDFDNGSFAFQGSYGYYHTDRVLLSARQALGGIGDGNDWNGSTVVAVDYHFYDDALRPFIGLNAGVSYGGGNVGDGFSAGAQTGVKYYVAESAFIFVRAEYSYTFDDVDDADDNWDQGSLGYNLGVGMNF